DPEVKDLHGDADPALPERFEVLAAGDVLESDGPVHLVHAIVRDRRRFPHPVADDPVALEPAGLGPGVGVEGEPAPIGHFLVVALEALLRLILPAQRHGQIDALAFEGPEQLTADCRVTLPTGVSRAEQGVPDQFPAPWLPGTGVKWDQPGRG